MKILLITTMYPNPLRENTKVCHYFAKEWVCLGHEVKVVHFRSVFPHIYKLFMSLFPKFVERHFGDYKGSDMYDTSVLDYDMDGVQVQSLPIYKLIPHRRYPSSSIKKSIDCIRSYLERDSFVPDAIIGHFANPQMEIVSKLGRIYKNAKTCVVQHTDNPIQFKKNYPFSYKRILNSLDSIGFRSLPVKNAFEKVYGPMEKSFLCFSGVPYSYVENIPTSKGFSDMPLNNYIYVGQFIARKYPLEVIKTLQNVYSNGEYLLTYVGKKEVLYEQIHQYVSDNHLENQVEFTGQIPRDEIIKLYDQAQCFVMISREETFGLVYLEAMSRGCIVVASKNEGMEGIIEDGVNGFLCEAGNQQELECVLKRINCLSKEQKEQLSQNAVATAKNMTDRRMAEKYLENVFKY